MSRQSSKARGGGCHLNILSQTKKKQPRIVHMYRKANTEGIEEELKQFSEEFMSSFEERTCSANWEEFLKRIPCRVLWNTTSLQSCFHADGTCLG